MIYRCAFCGAGLPSEVKTRRAGMPYCSDDCASMAETFQKQQQQQDAKILTFPTRFVCVDGDGKVAGIDEASGGYPWFPTEDSWQLYKFWPTREGAENYAKGLRLEVKEVRLSFV